jgi:hypothetical protein
LDTPAATPSTTWVHAGTHQAEAGYLDPSLGWVGVRAQASGVTVHAAIVPGSTEAAQALSGHLAGLNTWVAEHHGDSMHVTMDAPGHRETGVAADGQSNARNQQQPREAPAQQASFNQASPRPITTTARDPVQTQWAPPSATGAHISVLA